MKKVCDNHGQAYEATLGCPYCVNKEETKKDHLVIPFPISQAAGPTGCMDYLIEDKDLDASGYYTFPTCFAIRDVIIKTTKKVTIIGDILCLGSLKFNHNLSIVGSLQTKKSIGGGNDLTVSDSLIVDGMVIIGGDLIVEKGILVSKDIVASDIESYTDAIHCGGNIVSDNLSAFSGITAYGDLDIDSNIKTRGIIYCHKKIKGTIIDGTLQETP